MPSILDKGCRRFQHHANYAELLTLDIDGGMTTEEAIAHPFFAAHCGLAIETASSSPALNKFRAGFSLHPAQPALHDHHTIKICNIYLQHLIKIADPSCKDASRFYFGAVGRSPFILNESASLPETFVSDALAWRADQERIANLAYEEAQLKAARRRAEFGEPSERERFELVEQGLACIPPRREGSGNYDEWMVNSFSAINFTLAYPRINTSLLDFWLNREVLPHYEPILNSLAGTSDESPPANKCKQFDFDLNS